MLMFDCTWLSVVATVSLSSLQDTIFGNVFLNLFFCCCFSLGVW